MAVSSKTDGCQAVWPTELVLKDNKQLSMAFLELYPIVVAATLWGSEWQGRELCSIATI